jgi:transposase InsO family protein
MANRGAPGDAIFEYVEVYYNRRRRHSTLVYQTLAEYEQSAAEAA